MTHPAGITLGEPDYPPRADPPPAEPPSRLWVDLTVDPPRVIAHDYPRPLEPGGVVEAYLISDPAERDAFLAEHA